MFTAGLPQPPGMRNEVFCLGQDANGSCTQVAALPAEDLSPPGLGGSADPGPPAEITKDPGRTLE